MKKKINIEPAINILKYINKHLLHYFLSNQKGEAFIIQLKAKAFVIVNILGFFVNFLYLIVGIISNLNIDYLTHIFITLIIITDLILVRKGKFKNAGNFFTLALIILQIIILNVFSKSKTNLCKMER